MFQRIWSCAADQHVSILRERHAYRKIRAEKDYSLGGCESRTHIRPAMTCVYIYMCVCVIGLLLPCFPIGTVLVRCRWKIYDHDMLSNMSWYGC